MLHLLCFYITKVLRAERGKVHVPLFFHLHIYHLPPIYFLVRSLVLSFILVVLLNLFYDITISQTENITVHWNQIWSLFIASCSRKLHFTLKSWTLYSPGNQICSPPASIQVCSLQQSFFDLHISPTYDPPLNMTPYLHACVPETPLCPAAGPFCWYLVSHVAVWDQRAGLWHFGSGCLKLL